MKLAISVGHGQKRTPHGIIPDPGAVNKKVGIGEYKTSMKHRNLLLELFKEDERFDITHIQYNIPLIYRINQINELHAQISFDLAIELHLNSYKEPEPNFTEIYFWADQQGNYSRLGKKYGNIMVPVLVDELGLTDGKHDSAAEAFGDEEWEGHRNGFVRETNCPALIIEPWFISNHNVAREAKNGGLVAKTAVAIYKALSKVYEKEFSDV